MSATLVILIIAAIITLVSLDLGWNNVLNSKRTDLVFQDKFKGYGAYQMRKRQGWTLAIALGFTVFAALAGFGGPMLFGKKHEEKDKQVEDKIVEMLKPPPTDPNQPPPPPPPPPFAKRVMEKTEANAIARVAF